MNNDSNVNKISNEKIKMFLRNKNFDIVTGADMVIVYDIKKNLIEGTTDEYSNKLVLKDTLENEKAEKLLTFIKDDSSYDWNPKQTYSNFNPIRQFMIRNNSQRIFLLINEKYDTMSFVNLDGQKLVALSDNFSKFLIDY